MPETIAGPDLERCRWCGKKEISDGYHTCPICHRVQNRFFGWLQIWNATNWLAIFVAGAAIYFSYLQTDLARIATQEARAERLAAEEAVAEAKRAGDEALTARDQAKMALSEVSRARDDAKGALLAIEALNVKAQRAGESAEIAFKNAKVALRDVGLIEERVEDASEAIRRLLAAQLSSTVRDEVSKIEQRCRHEPSTGFIFEDEVGARDYLVERNLESTQREKLGDEMRQRAGKIGRRSRDRRCRRIIAVNPPQIEKFQSDLIAYESEGIDVKQARQSICELAKTLDRYDRRFGKASSDHIDTYCPATR